MREIIVIAHDMRSTHNIGSLFRTSDAMGVKKLYLTGYTAYPKTKTDSRLPHLAEKLDKQINKTALGAVNSVSWANNESVFEVIKDLKSSGYQVLALEQSKDSIDLNDYSPPDKLALLLGTELTGLTNEILSEVDRTVEIPMYGKKESLNVVQAAAMALYQFRVH